MKKIMFIACFLFLCVLIFSQNSDVLKKKAVNLVEKGLKLFKTMDKEKAYEKINDPKGGFVDGEFYLFVLDYDGINLAHGGNINLIGKNHFGLKDSKGKLFIQELIKIVKEKGSGWVEYTWSNPTTKKIQPKMTYAKKIEGMNAFIGCGFYYNK